MRVALERNPHMVLEKNIQTGEGRSGEVEGEGRSGRMEIFFTQAIRGLPQTETRMSEKM
jgi:hypothetical protein